MSLESRNPATNEVLQTYHEQSDAEIEQRLDAANSAYIQWRRVRFAERATHLRAAAEILRKRKDDYAALMAVEMGKPLAQGDVEAEKCAWVCEYYAENAEKFLSPEIIPTDAMKSFVTFHHSAFF